MNDNNIPIVEPTIDYTKVPPIHQKRTVSFINHFIVTTVSFLNKFILNCEEKLFEFENKLQRVEAALKILESRLASVPGLEVKTDNTIAKDCNEKTDETVEETQMNSNEVLPKSVDETDEHNSETNGSNDNKLDDNTESNLQPITKHPLYEKYFRMLNVGVPKPAVKIKMTSDGLDPAMLDDPQLLIPMPNDET